MGLIPGDGLVKFLRSEVRKEDVGEVELGIGQLPEHEAGEAGIVFAGADEKVRIGEVVGI